MRLIILNTNTKPFALMWEMLTFETLYNGQSTLSTQLIILNYSVLATLFRVGGGGEEGDMESVQLILFYSQSLQRPFIS